MDLPPLSPPTLLDVEISRNDVQTSRPWVARVRWSDVNLMAHEYEIEVRGEGKDWHRVAGGQYAAGYADLSGFAEGYAYEFRVRAVVKADSYRVVYGHTTGATGTYSDALTRTPLARPYAPRGLWAKPAADGATAVDVYWADHQHTDDGHVVVRREAGSGQWYQIVPGVAPFTIGSDANGWAVPDPTRKTTAVDETTFTDTTVKPLTRYQYQVFAANDMGASQTNGGYVEASAGTVDLVLDGLPEERTGSPNEHHAGAFIPVNDDDSDGDGIPDYADGFDWRLGNESPPPLTNRDLLSDKDQFTPMTLKVPAGTDLSTATFTFNYSGSHPGTSGDVATEVVNSGGDAYALLPTAGLLRVWRKAANVARDGRVLEQGGDYLRPGTPYTAQQLGLTAGQPLPLWVEGVKAGGGGVTVTVDSKPANSDANVKISDSVNVNTFEAHVTVDADRDGTMRFDSSDRTTIQDPFHFWTNQNAGYWADSSAGLAGGAQDDVGATPTDASTIRIGSNRWLDGDPIIGGWKTTLVPVELDEIFNRDLEDFAQIGISYPLSTAMVADTVSIRIANSSANNTAVRLWRSYRAPASSTTQFDARGHISSRTIAGSIMATTYNYRFSNLDSFRRIDGDAIEMPIGQFERVFGITSTTGSSPVRVGQLMFEGLEVGSGELEFEFKTDNKTIAKTSFQLDLRDVEDLYEHYTVAYGPGIGPRGDWSSSNGLVDPKVIPVNPVPIVHPRWASSIASSVAENDNYLLFVHGWNVSEADRIGFASTTYKRSFWQGFQGTVGMFSWPTQIFDSVADSGNFNRSEEVAWNSGMGLMSLLNTKQSVRQAGGKLVVVAHSMGGIVTSEALALAGNQNLVDAVVFSQAAVTTEFYGATAPATQYYSAFNGQVGSNMARFAHIDQAAGKVINYENENDYAVGFNGVGVGAFGLWMMNHERKPGGPGDTFSSQPAFLGVTYDAIAGQPATIVRNGPNGATTTLSIATDTYEMFAHGLYTDALAIGATDALIGPFTKKLDLRTIGFSNSRVDHSGQFSHSYLEMENYWSLLFSDTGL